MQTNFPARNDVLNLLDGALILALAVRSLGAWSWPRFHHLARALIPLAGCGVFLGLSILIVSSLEAEGLALGWVDSVRAALLAGAWLWSQWLALRILRRERRGRISLAAAAGFMTSAGALAASGWELLF